MRLNREFPTNLVTFIEEIHNGMLHFLCKVWNLKVLSLKAAISLEVLLHFNHGHNVK